MSKFYRSSFTSNIINKTSEFLISRVDVLVSSVVMQLKRPEIRETSRKKLETEKAATNMFVWEPLHLARDSCTSREILHES